jgi:hypothetical protein
VNSAGDRLRVSLAEYEAHRERTAREGGDPDAEWWYAAWAEALAPALREAAATPREAASPEILALEDEREILFSRLISSISGPLRHALEPGLTVADGAEAITAMAVTAVVHRLRVLSARQLAVLLAAEANRHEHQVIREPPHYTAEEIAGGPAR